MSRDYKQSTEQRNKRQSAVRRQQNHLPPWLWFFGGVAITAFFFVAFIMMMPPKVVTVIETQTRPASPEAAQQPSQPAAQSAAPIADEPPMDLFDFYTMLPSMEVEVPAEQLRPSPAVPLPAAEAAAMYQLQLGSFAREEDAKRAEARLSGLGIASRIEQVAVDGTNRFRVRSGPYSRDQAYSLHGRLTANQFDVLIMRVSAN